jgi:2-dehydropantoate 2-reductase
MRICVYGAGAVGGHLAAKLAAAGHEVSVVARGAQLAALRKNGVTLLHGEERIAARVKASEDPAALGAQDLVMVTLKANALSSLPGKIHSLMKSETAVVFAQNGIPWWYATGLSPSRPKPPDLSRLDPAGELKRAIPAERLIGAVIYSANDVIEPGVVMNHTAGNNMLVIGNCDDRESAEVQDLRQVLEEADLSSPPAPDIRQVVWAKLVMNMGTGTLCLLTGGTVADVRRDPATAKIVEQVLGEARAIARAHGVDASQAPKRPSGGHSSGQIAHKPSILQDYERGRPMEIEAQLATPLAFARAAGVVTPTLDMLIPLAVHKAAAKGLYTT